MQLLVHRYIRMRMSPHRKKVAEGERLEWHLYELREAFRLWHSIVPPPRDHRLEGPLRRAIVAMYEAHDPDQLDRLPVAWVQYQGAQGIG